MTYMRGKDGKLHVLHQPCSDGGRLLEVTGMVHQDHNHNARLQKNRKYNFLLHTIKTHTHCHFDQCFCLIYAIPE
jgi:hypothetical protein